MSNLQVRGILVTGLLQERCQSGRSELTANELSAVRRTQGSNPCLSALGCTCFGHPDWLVLKTMCGIIGSIGHKQIVEDVLIHGLKRLEYRGYDSAGLAVLTDKGLKVVKCKGKVTELENDPSITGIEGNIGIAHTRWATHGEPNQVNSHPHTDCQGKIAVAHNGIIENFHSLKTMLQGEGHRFTSETDTEVLAHLIEKFYQNDLEEAVIRALKLLE